MIKQTLLILMACASLTIANSAKAGLGWSLSECQDHYGNSLHYTPTSEYGRQKYVFRTGDYYISVWLFDDLVTCIHYKRADGGVISTNDIGTLLQANAPKADWSAESEKDSTGLVWWYGQLSRDPFAYQAEYTQDDVVGIFTRADLEMVNAKRALLSKDL
jgi:hypothetical protein